MRKNIDIDDDGMIDRQQGGEAQPIEAFVNDDLINAFIDEYAPGTVYNFTHALSRAELRVYFGAYIDFNTLDPLPAYINVLSKQGYKEKIGIDHQPCIYVIQREIEDAEVIDDIED